MAFRIGQKVVCVDAEPRLFLGRSWHGDPLIEGAVYTVAATNIPAIYPGECDCIRVEEATNANDVGYRASRFRPLVEKSTDTGMAILREILDRESVTERKPVRS